jgi:hypothetical protein
VFCEVSFYFLDNLQTPQYKKYFSPFKSKNMCSDIVISLPIECKPYVAKHPLEGKEIEIRNNKLYVEHELWGDVYKNGFALSIKVTAENAYKNCTLFYKIPSTVEIANYVYGILVNLGGANENDRDSFISSFTFDMDEWRFKGKFGFGGKYRKETNYIDYYKEDETEDLNILRDEINKALSEMF